MKVSFVLIEPAVPENIGAAARAINTMGFSDLRLVNPANHLADEAKWLAHGSVEILQKASIFHEFKSAIEDIDFLIGTTAKKRSAKHDYYTPEEANKLIIQKGDAINNIGIVFGREESGLTNEELALCDVASSIPLHKPYPSINLAQSVMLYAYIFSNLKANQSSDDDEKGGNARIFHELKSNANEVLHKLETHNDDVLNRRMMERIASVNETDAKLMLSFVKLLNRKIK